MEQTIEQLQKELQQSRDRISRLEKELEEFAYIASHDLQEPLRKISTFTQRLEQKLAGTGDADTNLYIERVQVSAGNMRNLIEGLLAFSRAGRNTAPAEVIRLDRLITEVLTELEPMVKEGGVQIDIGPMPVVEGVEAQLIQLFQHLLKNALVFRHKDRESLIRIYEMPVTADLIEAQALDPSRKYSAIVVEDNGIGFDNSYAERIFELFQRLHGKYEYRVRAWDLPSAGK